jgi:hypothetical protein
MKRKGTASVREGKPRKRVTRGQSEIDVARLAREAAVAELLEHGIVWTDCDTERLRWALGLLGPDRASLLLRKLGLALSTPAVRDAFREVRAFAEQYGDCSSSSDSAERTVAAFGSIEGPVRQLWSLAHETPQTEFVETKWREVLTDYAFQEVGWWSKGKMTPRKLALLAVLAGIVDFRVAGFSGRDAIAQEAKAMRYQLSAKTKQIAAARRRRRLSIG